MICRLISFARPLKVEKVVPENSTAAEKSKEDAGKLFKFDEDLQVTRQGVSEAHVIVMIA